MGKALSGELSCTRTGVVDPANTSAKLVPPYIVVCSVKVFAVASVFIMKCQSVCGSFSIYYEILTF